MPADDGRIDEPEGVAPYAVYTTLARERVEDALETKSFTFTERKRWTTAAKLFGEARDRRERLALLMSDGAHDCSSLVGWALIENLELMPEGTRVRAVALRPLRGRRTQELLLRSSGQPIAKDFIRPYAIVHRPAFIPSANTSTLGLADQDDAMTLFTFGYEGCGPGTARLVAAVEDLERARGFGSPLWVDTRISRSVRAVGFRDKAFEQLLGPQRYRWMPDLGNVRVKEGRRVIEIRRPEAVADLLQCALDAPRRRVIFFCSCPGAYAGCHRHEVGRLLIRQARRTRVAIRRMEWPGGEPTTLAFDLPTMSDLKRDTLETDGVLTEAEAAGVPWGSHGILRTEKRRAEHVLLGPALFGGKQTNLRIVKHWGPRHPTDPRAIGRRWRKDSGTVEERAL